MDDIVSSLNEGSARRGISRRISAGLQLSNEIGLLLDSKGIHYEGVFLGGSAIKKTNDINSDFDICVVAKDGELQHLAKNDWLLYKKLAGASHLYSYLNKCDLRIIEKRDLEGAVNGWIQLDDISVPNQDLLYNVQNGIYARCTPWMSRVARRICYLQEHQAAVIAESLYYIRDVGYRKHALRGDKLLIYENINSIYRALINITFALNGCFFLGYKHLLKLSRRLDIFPIDAVQAVHRFYKKPTTKQFKKVLEEARKFTAMHIELPHNCGQRSSQSRLHE